MKDFQQFISNLGIVGDATDKLVEHSDDYFIVKELLASCKSYSPKKVLKARPSEKTYNLILQDCRRRYPEIDTRIYELKYGDTIVDLKGLDINEVSNILIHNNKSHLYQSQVRALPLFQQLPLIEAVIASGHELKYLEELDIVHRAMAWCVSYDSLMNFKKLVPYSDIQDKTIPKLVANKEDYYRAFYRDNPLICQLQRREVLELDKYRSYQSQLVDFMIEAHAEGVERVISGLLDCEQLYKKYSIKKTTRPELILLLKAQCERIHMSTLTSGNTARKFKI